MTDIPEIDVDSDELLAALESLAESSQHLLPVVVADEIVDRISTRVIVEVDLSNVDDAASVLADAAERARAERATLALRFDTLDEARAARSLARDLPRDLDVVLRVPADDSEALFEGVLQHRLHN